MVILTSEILIALLC